MLPKVQFVSTEEADALAKRGELLPINVGSDEVSPFANATPRAPWVIDDSLEGVVPHDLWVGMTRFVGQNRQQQFAAGVELIRILAQWTAEGWDPFTAIPGERLTGQLAEYKSAYDAHRAEVEKSLARSEIWLVNHMFMVATNVSTSPEVLSGQYGLLPFNRVDFSLVYNPEWGKMSVGANTLGDMPRPSAAMQVWFNRETARQQYAERGTAGLANVNMDGVTATMLAAGEDLPFKWVKYVEALALANFSGRLNKRLPSLEPVGAAMQQQEQAKGTWGKSRTFQGSPIGQRTSITDPKLVLEAMAAAFPKVFDGAESSIVLVRPGENTK